MITVSGLYSGCELLFLVNSALCWALSRDSVDWVWLDITVCQQPPRLHVYQLENSQRQCWWKLFRHT